MKNSCCNFQSAMFLRVEKFSFMHKHQKTDTCMTDDKDSDFFFRFLPYVKVYTMIDTHIVECKQNTYVLRMREKDRNTKCLPTVTYEMLGFGVYVSLSHCHSYSVATRHGCVCMCYREAFYYFDVCLAFVRQIVDMCALEQENIEREENTKI